MECGELAPSGTLRYRAEIKDLVENELDHLLVTTVTDVPDPNPDEVAEWRFVASGELNAWLAAAPRTSRPGSSRPGGSSVLQLRQRPPEPQRGDALDQREACSPRGR